MKEEKQPQINTDKHRWVQNVDVFDVLIMVGFVVLGVGLGLYSVDLALTVMGVIMLTIGLAGAWRKGSNT